MKFISCLIADSDCFLLGSNLYLLVSCFPEKMGGFYDCDLEILLFLSTLNYSEPSLMTIPDFKGKQQI